jgi:hypothetical protein
MKEPNLCSNVHGIESKDFEIQILKFKICLNNIFFQPIISLSDEVF